MTGITAMAVDPTIRLICIAVLALMFLGSGIGKLRNMDAFADVMRSYALLPSSAVLPFAWLIALLEMGASLLLVTPLAALGAAIACALGLMFAGALSVNLARGHTSLDCGCDSFAALSGAQAAKRVDEHARIGIWHIARALLLAALALIAMQSSNGRSATFLDIIVGLTATVSILILLWIWDGLLRNAPKLQSLRQ